MSAHDQPSSVQAVIAQLMSHKEFVFAEDYYTATLSSLNNSGATGHAIFAFDEDTSTLTVGLVARGLAPDQTHIQHIHGFANGQDAVIPGPSFDTDKDGYIELAEGGPAWGPVLLNLTSDGAFPVAPHGRIFFVEQYQLDPSTPLAAASLDLRQVMIHGANVPTGPGQGTPGEVNGTGGYKALLPAASGNIEAEGGLGAALGEFLAADIRAQVDGLLGRFGGFGGGWFA